MFVTYYYPKVDTSKPYPKISYLALYEPWNWALGIGQYTDDIDTKIKTKQDDMKDSIKSKQYVIIETLLMFIVLATVISFIFSRSIQNIVNQYKTKIEDKNKKLEELNNGLELLVDKKTQELSQINKELKKRVKDEVSKNLEKERILLQQSKMATMGEMIGNIAHQWRQPLNALSLVIANIHDAYKLNRLNDAYMSKSSDKSQRLINKMSTTIDDFRNFFKPDKDSIIFDIQESVEETLSILEGSIKKSNITDLHA